MKIRFLGDADLKFQIVRAVKRLEPSVDFLTANQAGLAGIKDPQVLLYAVQHGRMLVTHDRNTMQKHFWSLIKAHDSPGIIVIPQRFPISAAANELVLMWAASKPQEWMNQIAFVPL